MNNTIDKYFHEVKTTVEDSVIFKNELPSKYDMIREIRQMYLWVLETDAEQFSRDLGRPVKAYPRNIKLGKVEEVDVDAFGQRLDYGTGLQVWCTTDLIFKVAFESKRECNKAKLKNSKLFDPLYMYRGH